MKRMRILVLLHEDTLPPDSVVGLSTDEMLPFQAEYDVLTALEELGHDVRRLALGHEILPLRQAVEQWQPDIALNLLLHFQEVGIYDAHVMSYLELLHVPYTGCNPRGLLIASDKALSKKVMAWHRVRVPAFAVFRRGSRVRTPRKLEFPLFVKSTVEHASQGISQASIVNDEKALVERVEFIHRRIGTDAIAERYIEGREITVGVLGNQRLTVFPAWEMTFANLPRGTEPIATSRVKWNREYQEKLGVECGPAGELDTTQASRLARIARRVYRALGLSGYARIDLRLDAEGRAFVLEANPNPDLSREEDFATSALEVGIEYPRLVQRILNLGLRHSPPWRSDAL
ncbi:MAG: D-alanine--D-alanine ligase [Planctomycetes bacterium]|jgi:D-alanine-D-alanine ligase|nr:D-alanine--D-alanine ligase [Planctomycetota bacterium]MDP6409894.1 ATP-grasp domain-containing protein [Planctomycetota bacterium]